jgi:hypothetical protein
LLTLSHEAFPYTKRQFSKEASSLCVAHGKKLLSICYENTILTKQARAFKQVKPTLISDWSSSPLKTELLES